MHSSMEPIDLFNKYKALSVKYAKREFKLCESFGYQKNDIICWALEALWKICVNKKKNVLKPQFMTYLSMRVHGEIIDNIRKDKINFGSKIGNIKMSCFSQVNLGENTNKEENNELDNLNVVKFYSSIYDEINIIFDNELLIYLTVDMDHREKYIVKKKFFENFKMVEIAKELGISATLASWTYSQKIKPKLKDRLSAIL